jgi:hypothetical protein
MPQVIPIAAKIAATKLVGAVTVGKVLSAVAIASVSSAISQALARKALANATSGSPLEMTRDPAPVARMIYGERRVSGPVTFLETYDDDGQPNEISWLVIPFCGREVDAIGPSYWVNDVPVLISTGDTPIGNINGYFWAWPHLGTTDQTADSNLVAASAQWTSAHRGRGVAHGVFKCKHNTARMPSVPNISAMVRGIKCFDPRNEAHDIDDPSTWEWTDNPALCLLDYLLDTDFGLAVDYDEEIDEAAFIAAANACDELVGLQGGGFTVSGDVTSGSRTIAVGSFAALEDLVIGQTVSGTGIPVGSIVTYIEEDTSESPIFAISQPATASNTGVTLSIAASEKRYRCSAVFETSAEPGVIIDNFVAAMAGEIYAPGGVWTVYAGVARTAEVTLTADDRRGSIEVSCGDAVRDSFNRVRGTFTFPGDNYNMREFPAVTNSLYLGEDNGVESWKDLELAWVPSGSQAQRTAKIELERSRQDITVRKQCQLTALRTKAGDVVGETDATYGWTDKPFLIKNWKFSEEQQQGSETPALVIDLEMREYATASFDWADGAETTVDPSPDTNLPPDV